ncbi:hypothetical protein ACQP2F_13005 [Actinoplanes sp. CA-030573]|uniref:hypothetical protein n=1 Tax=Actinoplanes sp. CA-030573 TaxID=3239898 RepID=UPI003D92F85A
MLSRGTFTVEIWYDHRIGRVAATRVVHLQSRAEKAWSGWRPERVTRFIRHLLPVRAAAGVSPPRR